MKTHFYPELLEYTGAELRSHFAYRRFDILGDSVVAFTGPCWVQKERLVDLEDQKAGEKIYSRSMLHFIIEIFERDLTKAVLVQRIFSSLALEVLRRRLKATSIVRKGDDLFDGDRKLTVSVATVSPVSLLIHFGINISSKDTPVPTRGLEDYGFFEARALAGEILDAFVEEWESLQVARSKVRAVQ